jgi:hypothetical protein
MKYLSFALAACLLASCSATKPLPQYTEAQKAAQRQAIGYWQPDTTATTPKLSPVAQAKLDAKHRRGQLPAPLAGDGGQRPLDSELALPPAGSQPGRSVAFWQKLNPFRAKQPATSAPLSLEGGAGGGVPRKCKGCTFIVGDNTTLAGKKAQVAAGDGATASIVEKKAGPAVVASDSSTLNALTGGGNLAAVQGDGNTTGQTKQDTTTEAPGVSATIAKYLTGPLGYVLAAAAVGGIVFLLIRRRAKQAAENLV